MKKPLLFTFILFFFAFTACKDETAPKIVLDGDTNMKHILNQTFTEPGYSAFDDEDGDITESVEVTSLDVNTAGIQYITYTAKDAEGNVAEAVRTVTVYNQMEVMAGNWIGEYVFPYPSIDKKEYIDSISPSTDSNMKIIFKDFAGNNNANLEGTVMLSGVPDAPAIIFSGQTIGGLAFTSETAKITNDFSRITFEYSIGDQDGVLVLAKQ